MPFVWRVSETPPTESVVCALTVVTPVTAELSVIVQLPVPPTVVHGFGGRERAGAAVDREADLRPGRRVHEAARAVVHVHVRRERVRRADRVRRRCGVIWMFASTNVLTASPRVGAGAVGLRP